MALFNCVAQGLQPLELAVSCVDAQQDAALASRMPCGACRQVMQELLPNGAIVHIDGIGERRIEQLLPDGFGLA